MKKNKPKLKQVLVFTVKVVTDCEEVLTEPEAVKWMEGLLNGCDVGEPSVTAFRFGRIIEES